MKVVVNANFGASSTEIADLKLYYVESESDVLVGFVAPSPVSSMQCESAETPAVKYYAYANEVVLNTHGLNDYVMCAKMDGNWILFPSVKLQVHAVADFSPKTFIAGSEYAVAFTGAAIAEEDAIFFTATDCEATSVLSTTTETATVRRVTFGAQQSALQACYGVKSVMMLAPVLLVMSLLLARRTKGGAGRAKVTIPWFAFGFLAVIGFNSLDLLPEAAVAGINSFDTFLLTMAMTALGAETSIEKFKRAGAKPFLLAGLLYLWLLGGGYLLSRWIL